MQQRHIDPFKIASWLGWFLMEEIQDDKQDGSDFQIEACCRVIVNWLAGILFIESKFEMPEDDMGLITSLLRKEATGAGCHGIGMNGLFIAFHCAKLASGSAGD